MAALCSAAPGPHLLVLVALGCCISATRAPGIRDWGGGYILVAPHICWPKSVPLHVLLFASSFVCSSVPGPAATPAFQLPLKFDFRWREEGGMQTQASQPHVQNVIRLSTSGVLNNMQVLSGLFCAAPLKRSPI